MTKFGYFTVFIPSAQACMQSYKEFPDRLAHFNPTKDLPAVKRKSIVTVILHMPYKKTYIRMHAYYHVSPLFILLVNRNH